jgi:hypothetical protein
MTAPATTETTEQPPGQPEADPGTPTEETVNPENGGQEDELPEWARQRLTKANAEAANYRVRLREAEKQLSEAKSPDELDAAVTSFKERNAQLERELTVSTLARRYGLPDDLANSLKEMTGKTPQELEAHAKVLQKYAAPAEPVVLSGGLDPADDGDTETDPRALARRYGGRR